MAAGDLIYNQGISIVEFGAAPTWIPSGNQSQWAKEQNTSKFYYFDGSSWDTFNLDFNSANYTNSILGGLSSDNQSDYLEALGVAIDNITNDGNATNVVRTNATEDVAPTAAEVPNPENGDTADVSLTNQKVEKWSYTGGAWVKAFTLDFAMVVIPVQTVANTATINLTLDANGELTASVNLSATQDNQFAITEETDGIKITAQTLTAYVSLAAAQADAGLAVGNAFVLAVANLDGVPSDGVTGPVFRKQ